MNSTAYGKAINRALVILVALLISACTAQTNTQFRPCKKGGPGNNHCLVKISFDKLGCPISVDEDSFDVEKARRIYWVSVYPPELAEPPEYEIYFDPFKGNPIKTRKNAKVSPRFDRSAPDVVYKYTIVGTACKHKPLDPRFRLR